MDDITLALEKLSKIEEKTKKFEEMLSELVSSDDKKKLLWKEIYENALQDRQNANMLFEDSWSNMAEGSTGHATLGPVMTKYLERMSKSNEQILRLAELIAKAEEESARIDPDDIFSEING